MKVLITGASGLLGGNCVKYFLEQGCAVLGTHMSFPTKNTVYFNTMDLSDPKNTETLAFNAEVIVHCGALVNADHCEQNEKESFAHSVGCTANLVHLAKETNAYFVFISSDYVFDGENGPYTENDIPNPVNIYGHHKMQAEKMVQKELPNHLIIRITNVYGEEIRGKNFVSRIVRSCREQQEKYVLGVPCDQFATPIDAFDVAKALFLLISDRKSGLYHLASTDYLSRFELATRVASYFPDSKLVLKPVLTVNMNQVAKRPLQGGLIKRKFTLEYPYFQFASLDKRLRHLILT